MFAVWEKALRGKFEWPGWRSEEENAKEEFPGIQPVPNEISEDVESSGPSPHQQQQNTGVNRGGLLRPPGSEDVASRYPNAVWVKPDPTLMRRLSQEPGNAVPAPITLPQDPRNAVAATRALPQDPWNPVPAQKILPQNPRNIIPAPPLSPGSRNALFTPPLSPGSRNALFIPSFSHGSRKAPPTPGNFPHVRRNAFPKPPFPRPVDNRNPFSTFHR
ncbi:unnamed protein product [Darwinula stevensoni]|uniref:Uncharacterized protein n=1 Tax=Darwinula stevensoni TaxID=69355 RepID=A0A7R9FRL0_9CRUS|nr:unnamed protein product [Darwinula stevensoni]CAG0901205.1 unnamed protein product [Darwinula stevensoni]